jgi:hypothetical protein
LRDIDAACGGWLSNILERGRQDECLSPHIDIDLVSTTIITAIRGVGAKTLVGGGCGASDGGVCGAHRTLDQK